MSHEPKKKIFFHLFQCDIKQQWCFGDGQLIRSAAFSAERGVKARWPFTPATGLIFCSCQPLVTAHDLWEHEHKLGQTRPRGTGSCFEKGNLCPRASEETVTLDVVVSSFPPQLLPHRREATWTFNRSSNLEEEVINLRFDNLDYSLHRIFFITISTIATLSIIWYLLQLLLHPLLKGIRDESGKKITKRTTIYL